LRYVGAGLTVASTHPQKGWRKYVKEKLIAVIATAVAAVVEALMAFGSGNGGIT
jgi:hypothetical protein